VSRITTGKLRLELSSVCVREVVTSAVDAVRATADARRIDLAVDLGAAPILLQGDRDRLRQIVWNLLTNAIKFTPAEGSVRVRVIGDESDVEVSVTDTGRGIEPARLAFVFERFRQADGSSTRASGGLGLGLSIVKHLAELHGGTVEARSKGAGKGATFLVRLPRVPRPPRSSSPRLAKARVHTVTPVPSAEAADLVGRGILVVDDEPDAREVVAEMLGLWGAVPRIAACATEALDELARGGVEVMVSDIAMPGEDGHALIRRVRRLPGPRLPAVALSAYTRGEDRARALVAGFDAHVAKPVEPERLRAVLARLVGRVALRASPC